MGLARSVPPSRLGQCGSSCLGGARLGDVQFGVSPYPLAPRLGHGRFCCKPRAWPQSGAACACPGGGGGLGNPPWRDRSERGARKRPPSREGCPCGSSITHHHSGMCPRRAQPHQDRHRGTPVGVSAGGRALRGCCRSSASIRLGPCPGEGEICISTQAKCKMPLGPLKPAGLQTPPALTWFVRGPAAPMPLSHHPGGSPLHPRPS